MVSDYIDDQRIKGLRYAKEPERIQLTDTGFLLFNGRHSTHKLHQIDGDWQCDCHIFQMKVKHDYPYLFCAHSIAVERMNGSFPKA